MTESILRTARTQIKDSGRASGERKGADYQEQIMSLRRQMNEAKLQAMKKAEAPFLVEMKELEEEYAVFLKLSS